MSGGLGGGGETESCSFSVSPSELQASQFVQTLALKDEWTFGLCLHGVCGQ